MGEDIPRTIWSQLSRIMAKSGSGLHSEDWKSIQISYIQSYTVTPVLKINQPNLVDSFKMYREGHPQNDLVTAVPDHRQIRIRTTLGRQEKHTNIIYSDLQGDTSSKNKSTKLECTPAWRALRLAIDALGMSSTIHLKAAHQVWLIYFQNWCHCVTLNI